MTFIHRAPAEGPELAPPEHLLRMRDALVRPPSARTRATHLAAIASAMGERHATPASRWASRGVKGAAAVVAALTITSGLAAAEVLPPPAQRIFSSVSSHFSPPKSAPAHETPAATDGQSSGSAPEGNGSDGASVAPANPDADTAPTTAAAPSSTTVAPSTTSVPKVTTTVPGPSGPGSGEGPTEPTVPGEPADPGGDPTEPGPTDPEPGDGTVTATDLSTTTTTTPSSTSTSTSTTTTAVTQPPVVGTTSGGPG